MEQNSTTTAQANGEHVAVRIVQAKHATHFRHRGGLRPKYIVLHYTGVANQDAKGAIAYFASTTAASSAHFVVGPRGIYQVLPVSEAAWHISTGEPDEKYERVGDAIRYHESASGRSLRGNGNSIGVEMVVRKAHISKSSVNKVSDKDWYFEPETIDNAAKIVAVLAELLQIPSGRIIRHMDATGKPCPRPFVSLRKDGDDRFDQAWAAFKHRVEELRPLVYISEGRIL